MKFKLNFILFLTILFMPSFVTEANESVVPYSIEAVIPNNQVDQGSTYFDIEMEKGETQKLEVVVYNSSDEPITIEAQANSATTNSNGLIIYDAVDLVPHDSMSHPFAEIATIAEYKIEIEPQSQETVTITVEAPDESFDGLILGGLYFSQEADESEEDSGVQIQNQYSYALAVQIREAGNDNDVEPELDLLSLEAGLINHRTGLQTSFVNTAPTIIGGLEFTGDVYAEGSEEPLYTRTVKDFNIAPNSEFNFPVMFENQGLEAGDYVFKGTASNGDHEWSFEEMFTIEAEAAEEANDEAVEIEEEEIENEWMMPVLIGLGVLVVLLLVTIIYLLVKRRK
ncbi:DUF916 and DUF3324 domain-containing protein [Salinicoccus kekensis]|uniref:Uncharacterized protein DUF916 n=1 Tax=Salinicoccus kekensis TaxID=714307 RepID=A0A285UFL3_9STAP|nr:DUF916 and DUF3324 domain-containing protein [Salinicoccus kekensis]SOC40714.1 uncharacterized protein DUF916 [Salinicoccus kekensis]